MIGDIEILKKLKGIMRYDLSVDIPGCNCCSPSIAWDEFPKHGVAIKSEEFDAIIKEVEESVKRLLNLALATGGAHGMSMNQKNAESWIKENLK